MGPDNGQPDSRIQTPLSKSEVGCAHRSRPRSRRLWDSLLFETESRFETARVVSQGPVGFRAWAESSLSTVTSVRAFSPFGIWRRAALAICCPDYSSLAARTNRVGQTCGPRTPGQPTDGVLPISLQTSDNLSRRAAPKKGNRRRAPLRFVPSPALNSSGTQV